MNKSEQLIACLEGEIAKRDEELAACRVAVENCEMFRAELAAIKAQGVVMPDVNAAAKALCNRHAMICGVDADDQWKEYSQDFIADAETVLANARLNAAPVQRVSVPDGWKLVPVEPTLDMGWAYVDAANDASPGKRNSFNHFGYRAMLAAAPAPGGE